LSHACLFIGNNANGNFDGKTDGEFEGVKVVGTGVTLGELGKIVGILEIPSVKMGDGTNDGVIDGTRDIEGNIVG